jgi:hypothetical protein
MDEVQTYGPASRSSFTVQLHGPASRSSPTLSESNGQQGELLAHNLVLYRYQRQ